MQDGVNCVIINDGNRYDHRNQIIAEYKGGTKVWNDRANHQIVNDIRHAVADFECGKRDYAQMVSNNKSWRQTFDYELVLQYFAVLLNRISGLDDRKIKKNIK